MATILRMTLPMARIQNNVSSNPCATATTADTTLKVDNPFMTSKYLVLWSCLVFKDT